MYELDRRKPADDVHELCMNACWCSISIKSFLQAIKPRITHEKVNALKCVCICSIMSDSATPWTVAHQGPLSVGLSQQEYWSRWPFPPQEDFPDPEMEPVPPAAPALAGRFFSCTIWDALKWLSCNFGSFYHHFHRLPFFLAPNLNPPSSS